MGDKVIKVSKVFSKMPCVRYRVNGKKSGEEFREDILAPALKENDTVEVDLNGVIALGSSFLDEAFAGLIRERHFTYPELTKKLKITFELESYIKEAWGYMKDAKPGA